MEGSTLLVRSRVVMSEEPLTKVATQDQYLAVQARQAFGYTVLAKAIDAKTAVVAPGPRQLGLKLAQALAHLEIDPFTKESVTQYKIEQAKLQNSKVKLRHKESFVVPLWRWSAWIFYGGLIVAMLEFIAGMISYIMMGADGPGNSLMAATGVCFLVAVVSRVLSFVFLPRTIHSWKWHRVRINEYKKPIPQFALHKAVQLARAVPKVGIYVDELVQDKWNGDPFLVAVCGDREEYFEVFDEPAFERNL